MIKTFFISIFNLFFLFIILINVMMRFGIGQFADASNTYFGITTIIEIFDTGYWGEGTIPYYINQALEWLNNLSSRLTIQAVDNFQTAMNRFSNPPFATYSEVTGLETFFTNIGVFFVNVGTFFVTMGYLLSIIFIFMGIAFGLVGSLLVYLIYLIAVMYMLFLGRFTSTMPIGAWSYPSV